MIRPILSAVAMRSRRLLGLPCVKNDAEERSSDYADVACASAWRLSANGAARPTATLPLFPVPPLSLPDVSSATPRERGRPVRFLRARPHPREHAECPAPRARDQTPWRVRLHSRDCMTRVRITAAILFRWKARLRDAIRRGDPRHGAGLFSRSILHRFPCNRMSSRKISDASHDIHIESGKRSVYDVRHNANIRQTLLTMSLDILRDVSIFR